ncbi:MAG: NCS2 family permease [Candidatus Eisenbacteria bacterium]
MIERLFRVHELGSTVRREALGGATTFFTLSYILFVQPAILSACGMDHGAVALATCVASAFATLLMAFLANLPIALAPGMGPNFFFAFSVCGAMSAGGYGYPWTVALGAVFVSGSLFTVLSLTGVRSAILHAFPACLRTGIAVGIGLMITLVGLQYAGLVVGSPGTLISLGRPGAPPALAALAGTAAAAVFLALRIRGAMLLGVAAAAVVGALLGLVRIEGVVGFPRIADPALLRLDIPGVFREPGFVTVLFVFLFLDLFDTLGTLLGVCETGGLMENGKLPRAKEALFSDAAGTVAGSILGTSTVTSYVESAAGIAEGARTGLASVVTALLFLFSLAFYPLVRTIGGGVEAEGGVILRPFIAPPLILIGAVMMRTVGDVNWKDPTEYLPAFLPMVIIPFSFKIHEGIAFGFIAYSLLKLVTGRAREGHWLLHLLAGLFVLRYLFLE